MNIGEKTKKGKKEKVTREIFCERKTFRFKNSDWSNDNFKKSRLLQRRKSISVVINNDTNKLPAYLCTTLFEIRQIHIHGFTDILIYINIYSHMHTHTRTRQHR